MLLGGQGRRGIVRWSCGRGLSQGAFFQQFGLDAVGKVEDIRYVSKHRFRIVAEALVPPKSGVCKSGLHRLNRHVA
jgi:hypothetical protein